ncbi:MAG: histidine kinase N-terminal 7TM domain-containing protein [Anaerolineae bacterium]
MNTWGMYLYIGAFSLSVVIMTSITVYAWRHRRVSSASAFARSLTCALAILWGSLLRTVLPPDNPFTFAAFSLTMIGIVTAPPAWLFFALDYSGYADWLTRRRVLVLSLVPALSIVLFLSNPLHHAFYRELRFYQIGFLTSLNWVYGPWFYVHTVYSYALMLVGAVLLIRFAVRTFHLYRLQAWLLVLGACSVLIPNIVSTLQLSRFSYMFAGFLVMAILYGQAIFRYRLLNLAPVARHTLVDTLSDGMLVVDAQETVVDLNPAMAKLLAVDTQTSIGRPVWDFLPSGADWEMWLRAPAGAQTMLTLPGSDGPRVYDVQVSLFYDRWKNVSGRMLVLHDITERQQAAEALERYAQELEARNAELDAFAHTVAHDLKNPLSAVVGYGEFLTSRYDRIADEQRLSMLNTIVRQGKRMSNIIDELMLMASLRRLGDVSFSPLDMGQIVAEVQERLAMVIEEKHAHINLPESWPAVVGYAAWVEEILANYLSNAIKYGGNPPEVTLGWDVQGAFIRFWVRDNGAGLTPEEQARLFTPFTRLDQISAKGHGLGLSIVRRISDKLGGQVGVVSTPGEGSTFWFTLSVFTAEAAEKP